MYPLWPARNNRTHLSPLRLCLTGLGLDSPCLRFQTRSVPNLRWCSGRSSLLEVSTAVRYFEWSLLLGVLGHMDHQKQTSVWNTSASAIATTSKALIDAREWIHAQEPRTPLSRTTQIPVRPLSIPPDVVTCNTDAAWKKESSAAGLAWIFDSSSPLFAFDRCQYQQTVPSAIMAEGLAVRGALSHAQHIGITKIWLRSDFLSLVRAKNSIAKPMNLYGVLWDIESLSSSFDFCCISFIPRK